MDTLVASKIIEAAPLNNNCRADVEKKSLLTVPLNAATKEKIKSAKHAVVLAKFNTRPNATCNGQFIKIYSDYHLKVKVGAQFNYKVKL